MQKTITTILLSTVIGAVAGVGGAFFYDWAFDDPKDVQTVTTASGETVRVVEENDTTDVVQEVSDSVVSITISKEVSTARRNSFRDPFFDDFFDTPVEDDEFENVEVGGGTGFVITADGLIATNKHVVDDEEATYTVAFNDQEVFDAEVVARDPLSDFAILRIDPKKKELEPLPLGDSDTLAQGQTVIAIGNTLAEYDNTVTKGIVSGLSRDLGGSYSGLVQTDAAINEGNSGGPLLNLAGEVVGINTAVDRSGEGIGFAIPINRAKAAISSVEEHGRIIRAGLGVRYLPITAEIAEANNLPVDYGAYIRGDEFEFGVITGGAADKAGINEGDIILEVDGTRVDGQNTLADLILDKIVGDTVQLKVYQDGEENDLTVTLEELPDGDSGQEEEVEEE